MAAILQRNRILYGILLVSTIIGGYTIRQKGEIFPNFIALYAPDAFWALMVFWLLAWLFSIKPTYTIAVMALLFSYTIELSQLYQAEWINAIRETTLGGLVLGFGFLWSDIAAYTLGISIGVLLEKWIILKHWQCLLTKN